ncbi:MAG: valine--tRNA ligase [Deltaproteobacteria bacterium]|nr:valine--tRNA ligase [Deltaproteobacteria bacterium]
MGSDLLSKAYNPQEIEGKWFSFWEKNGFFKADINGSNNDTYSIVIPPPNITGSLHVGHALNNTLQDILIRWNRLQGKNTLWQFGIDHAGIATQNVLERQLAAEGLRKEDLGLEAFVERVWQWKKESGGRIVEQLKRLGASCDWQRERFTMDEGLSRAVREVFVRLYEEGLIYKGDYMINWCPRCQTALSDLEVNYEELKGQLYYFNYPILPQKEQYIVVATTRPETMLGDTAVAVHPEDERYRDLIGKTVLLPLMDREIPIIADLLVDPQFGTGAVKVTPAHDPNDFEMGNQHKLLLIKIINEQGNMTEEAGKYQGMDRFSCRKKVLKDLETSGYLAKREPYQHAVGHCYRCKTIIEPLVSKQWFLSMKSLAEPAIEVVKTGKVRFIPSHWENTYFEWMNNIRDWCISRQIWWGHRIPAWHCLDCHKIIVAKEDPAACQYCKSTRIEQETDVLDTWFSSALWPFSTMGWPEQTKEMELFYPTSTMVTGFDILFFWVARMIMMGLKFTGKVPFSDVYIHALIRDEHGHKMSKSRGNVIDPLVMIDKYGTDPFRFTLTALAAQGRDICLSEKRIEGDRHFCNKIWNASRFVLMNIADFEQDDIQLQLTLADRWIISRANYLVKKVDQALGDYKFNEAADAIYQFLWHEFCDWYIELVKARLFSKSDPQSKATAQFVLIRVLRDTMVLLHPIMPFITEEIWQKLPSLEQKDGKNEKLCIMTAAWSVFDPTREDEEAEEKMALIMDVTRGIRNIRADINLHPTFQVEALIKALKKEQIETLSFYQDYIRDSARCQNITIAPDLEKPKNSISAVVRDIEIYVRGVNDSWGKIDSQEEKKKLERKISKIDEKLVFLNKKLGNEDFMKKAPSHIVEKERQTVDLLNTQKLKLQQNLKLISEEN